MTFSKYLKEQLTDFVESYTLYFKKTFGVALLFTLLCFVIAALLLRFSKFDITVVSKQISLLSYFFHRYSKANTYSIIDLTKTVFIFFVSLFSIGLLRLPKDEVVTKEIPIKYFFRTIKGKDIFSLLTALVIASILDFALFKIGILSTSNMQNWNAVVYIHDTLFHCRIYLPLILFALTIRSLTGTGNTKLSFKRILWLYISLLLFNECAYEISMWTEAHLFGLVLMPFTNPEKYYLFESFLGIPLIAFYFFGFFSAMTTSLKLTEQT